MGESIVVAVGDCTAQVGSITPAVLPWVDYDDGESHLQDLSALKVMLETSSERDGVT